MKTGMAIVVVAGFIGLVAGLTLVILTGHDATGYVTQVGLLLTTIAGFVSLLVGLRKQAEEIRIVKRNTNGNLSALQAEVKSQSLKLEKALSLLPAEAHGTVMEETVTPDMVKRIVDEQLKKDEQ
jgi:hypothetical protein